MKKISVALNPITRIDLEETEKKKWSVSLANVNTGSVDTLYRSVSKNELKGILELLINKPEKCFDEKQSIKAFIRSTRCKQRPERNTPTTYPSICERREQLISAE